MTRLNMLRTDFSAGELDPGLAGRTDLAAHRQGARRLRNVIVQPTGGVSRRPGLRLVATAPGPGRLAAFELGGGEACLLLFADRALRVYRDGTQVALLAAPWRADELAQLSWTQSAEAMLIAHPDHAPRRLARLGEGAWSLGEWSWSEKAGRLGQPYYRYAPASVTLTPSGVSGRITLTASADVFEAAHKGLRFRIGKGEVSILAVASARAATAEVTAALDAAQATADWREPAFSALRGWPVSLTFHQNRLAIGGARSLPDRLWLSRSGDHFDFDPGSGLDDEGIEFPLLSDRANAVRALVSGRRLQVFASGSEWTVSGDPLTPASIQLSRQTRIGSPGDRAVAPLDVEGATLFLARSGRELREFPFADAELAWRAADLALLSRHLFVAPVEMAWDGAGRRLLVAMGDGSMAALTVERAERIHAWTRFETAGAFRSVAAVGDAVHVLVERDGRFLLEVFDETLAMDGAVAATAPLPTRSWGGLGHLEGRRVVAIADGAILEDLPVSGGRIALPAPARQVAVGLAFAHIVEPPAPDAPLPEGALQGVAHRAVRVTLRLDRAETLRCDTGFGLRRVPLGPAPFTGDVSLGAGGWRRDGARPLWRIEDARPLPFHLLSAATELKVTDI